MIEAYPAWCAAVILAGVAWILASKGGNTRAVLAKVFAVLSVCFFGWVVKAALMLFSSQSINELAIATLAIIMSIVAAYGVYVSQIVDKKLALAESRLAELREQIETSNRSNFELTRLIDRHQRELEGALKLAQVHSLKQSILVHLPEKLGNDDGEADNIDIVRGIARDAIAHSSPREINFDCNEIVAICARMGVPLENLLGKATESFRRYHELARAAADNDDAGQAWI